MLFFETMNQISPVILEKNGETARGKEKKMGRRREWVQW
jgi:hypothetical protein